jgi:hypothetical protein
MYINITIMTEGGGGGGGRPPGGGPFVRRQKKLTGEDKRGWGGGGEVWPPVNYGTFNYCFWASGMSLSKGTIHGTRPDLHIMFIFIMTQFKMNTLA